jgi:hypothetical protein
MIKILGLLLVFLSGMIAGAICFDAYLPETPRPLPQRVLFDNKGRKLRVVDLGTLTFPSTP